MKSVNLSELSDQEPLKKEKASRFMLGVIIGAMIAFVLLVISLFFQKKHEIALSSSATLLLLAISISRFQKELKAIKTEIEARKS